MSKFQFTHPGKGATNEGRSQGGQTCRFNSRTLGRVRPELLDEGRELFHAVSIHAPWEGCDRVLLSEVSSAEKVSIHAPWEGCDCDELHGEFRTGVSIHAPWEGCDIANTEATTASTVSIHAPWEGCD